MRLQGQAGAGRSCDAGVVRLRGAGGEEQVGTLFDSVGAEHLQLADLVAAHPEPSQVVTLDQ